MKKLLIIFSVIVCVSADAFSQPSQLTQQLKLVEGTNSLPLPGNKGTYKFVKQGSSFSNVVFVDPTGRSQTLKPSAGINAECKSPLPAPCFGTADKTVGLCICKPASDGNN